MIEIGDSVTINDLRDYPPMGLRDGMHGTVMGIYNHAGHKVAQVLPEESKGLKFVKEIKTFPLSLSRLALACLILFLPSLAHCQQQFILGPKPSQKQLAEAEATLASNVDNVGNLKFGGYATIQIKVKGELTPYIVPGSDNCITTRLVPKGTIYEGFVVSKDADGFKWLKVPADNEYDRLFVFGSDKGTSTILWITVENGKAVVVDGFKFNVGEQKPPKPVDPPVEDALVKTFRTAAQKDAVAGKADKKWLPELAGIFEIASEDSLEDLATMGDLDSKLDDARKRAKIPEPEQQFFNLRKAIQEQIYTSLGINANSKQLKLTTDLRVSARACMAKIAKALEELAK